MAHPIVASEKQIKEAMKLLQNQLRTTKATRDSINLKVNLSNTLKGVKAEICFTEQAWYKMNYLIELCNKEIGWHGTMHRGTEAEHTFWIDDIFVFPQTVTAATVTPDAQEYFQWLSALPSEVCNTLRFHGHSHVNMGTTPSGTDTKYQDDLLQNVPDFYFFGIFNKKGVNTCVLYDVEKNICFEDKDLVLVSPTTEYADWASDQIKANIKEVNTAYASSAKASNTPAGYGSYYGGGAGYYQQGEFTGLDTGRGNPGGYPRHSGKK